MVRVVSAVSGGSGSGRGIGGVCGFGSRAATVVVRRRCSAPGVVHHCLANEPAGDPPLGSSDYIVTVY